MSQTVFNERYTFIIDLGKALHKFGTPAHRLETHLSKVAPLIGVTGSFAIAPTSMTFVLSDEQNPLPQTYMVRVQPGDIDLGSLAKTDELVEQLEAGELSLEEAKRKLTEISDAPEPYSGLITLLSFGFSGGAFAMLMQSSWNDVLWATLLSLVNFFLLLWAQKSKRVAHMLEPLVALMSAFVGCGIAYFDPGINIPLVVLSAIIIFIPGLSLTVGLAELSNRHLVSGTARFMDGVMTMLKLYFGAVLGLALGKLAFGHIPYWAPQMVPQWTTWIAVAILASCLVVSFKARLKDAPWGILSGFIAYSATLWASNYLDIALSAFVGALAMGIYANLFARFRKTASLVVSLQGLVLLVPGSKVYIGLNTLISGESMVATSGIGPQTLMIFMSLVAGLIFANVIVAPSRSL